LEVQWLERNPNTYKEEIESESVEVFLYKEILKNDDVRLEEQPKAVCLAIGRLVDRLMEKGLLNLEDLQEIVTTGYQYYRRDLTIKLKEEE
jgi:hypothetical protein